MSNDLRQRLIGLDREHSKLRRRFAATIPEAPADNAGFRSKDGSKGQGVIVVNVNVQSDPDAEGPKVIVNPESEAVAEVEGEANAGQEMASTALRTKLIRLLYEKPELRSEILPLLGKANLDISAEAVVVPVQTRECFKREVLPVLEQFTENMGAEDARNRYQEMLDEARLTRNDLYSLLKHYINADQNDDDYFDGLQQVLTEWATNAA